jgi:hypothetical protein
MSRGAGELTRSRSEFGVGTGTVQRIRAEMTRIPGDAIEPAPSFVAE